MVQTIPLHIQKSAKSDIDYLLRFINMDDDLDAELFHFEIELEDEDGERYDVSVKSTISFGYDPRQHIEFDWDYFVDGDSIKFWNHSDINMLAIELKNKICTRRSFKR